MMSTLRKLRMLAAIVLAAMVGTVPACGSMGGGGMKYVIDPSPDSSIVALALQCVGCRRASSSAHAARALTGAGSRALRPDRDVRRRAPGPYSP